MTSWATGGTTIVVHQVKAFRRFILAENPIADCEAGDFKLALFVADGMGDNRSALRVDERERNTRQRVSCRTTVPALSKKSIGNLVIRTIFGDALKTMVVMTGVHLELAQTILKDGISYSLF